MNALLRVGSALGALALLALLMGLLAGVFEEKIPPGRLPALPVPVDGVLAEVRLHLVPQIEQAVGTLQPKEETQVSSRIFGTIVGVGVREGDLVQEGSILVELDRRELTARVEQARQASAAAKARLEEARSSFERVSTLAERGVAAAAELDRVRATLESAQAQQHQAHKVVEEAETARSHAILRAPISGRVIHRMVEPGDTATPGSPLLHLYQPGSLRLEAHVRESLAAGLSTGDRLEVRIDALDRTLPAIVDETVPAADPGSRSFVVKAVIPSRSELYPGMFGRLLIPTGTVEHVSIPAAALRRVGQLEYVLVADDTGASRRYIRTGVASHDGRIEVLSGLRPGEQVVLPPKEVESGATGTDGGSSQPK